MKRKTLVANTDFFDKYTSVRYEKGTEFIVSDTKETENISDKKYKVSKERYEELKRSQYVD